MPDSAADFWMNQMGRIPLLSKEENLRLGKEVAAGRTVHPDGTEEYTRKSAAAVRRLAAGNLRLVPWMWQNYYQQAMPPSSPALPDLFQEGAKGLHRAAQKFDPERGYQFGTYATTWIRKGFFDYLRNQNRTIRMPSNAHQVADSVLRNYRDNGDGGWRLEDQARLHKVKPELLRIYLEQYAMTRVESLDKVLCSDGKSGESLGALQASPEPISYDNDERAAQDFRLVADRAGLSSDDRTILLAWAQGFSAQSIDDQLPQLAPSGRRLESARRRFRNAAVASRAELSSLCAA